MTENFSKTDVCSEISEDLSAFIDGELSKEQLAKIYEHLLECNGCQQAYEEMKTTQKAISNYFKRSTEEFEIPEKVTKDNIISKIIFIQRQRKFIYSAAALGFLAILSYFSISMINFHSPEKEALHKIKFTKEKPALAPLPPVIKEFARELKDKKVLKKKTD
jgi:hypothetical protein